MEAYSHVASLRAGSRCRAKPFGVGCVHPGSPDVSDRSSGHRPELSRSGDVPSQRSTPRAVVGYAGQWSRLKGTDVLLEAARRLDKEGNPATFLLAGSPSLWSPKSPAWEADIPTNTQVVGLVPHVQLARFWARAAVAVQPTTASFEGMPLSMLEAMACGVPVIGSDVPGVRDLVKPGVNGVLVPPGDAQALADAIAALLDRPEDIARMGRNARRTAEGHSLERMLDRIVALLEGRM